MIECDFAGAARLHSGDNCAIASLHIETMHENDEVPAEGLGAMALALGRNEFFATALAALQRVVPFRGRNCETRRSSC